MYKQLSAPAHVLAAQFSGKMSGQDIDQYKAQLDKMFAQHKRIGIYIDFTGWSDIDGQALIKGAAADLNLLAHIKQVGRIVIVSDKQWPQMAVVFADKLLPGVEAKVFGPAENEKAMAWVSQVPDKAPPVPSEPAIHIFPTTKDNVLGFEVDGVVGSGDLGSLIDKFNTFLKNHDKVRLLNRIKHIDGINPSVFFQSGLISMKFAALQKVERYAIVGAPGWAKAIIDKVSPAFGEMEIRTFPADQEDAAWNWLEAKPA